MKETEPKQLVFKIISRARFIEEARTRIAREDWPQFETTMAKCDFRNDRCLIDQTGKVWAMGDRNGDNRLKKLAKQWGGVINNAYERKVSRHR